MGAPAERFLARIVDFMGNVSQREVESRWDQGTAYGKLREMSHAAESSIHIFGHRERARTKAAKSTKSINDVFGAKSFKHRNYRRRNRVKQSIVRENNSQTSIRKSLKNLVEKNTIDKTKLLFKYIYYYLTNFKNQSIEKERILYNNRDIQ